MAASDAKPTLSELLYERCNKHATDSEEGLKKAFNQEAIVALCDSEPLDQLQDLQKLLPVISQLVTDGLFLFLKSKEQRIWTLRPRDDAEKIKNLTKDERMVYTLIEESNEAGVWIRALKLKTGIKDGKTMDKILRVLEKQKLIKNVTGRKTSAQKTYVLYNLEVNGDTTGASFYDEDGLDESLIEELRNVIVFHVRQMSWVDQKKKQRIKRETSPILIRDDVDPNTEVALEETRPRKKRKRDTTTISESRDIEDAAPPRKHRSHRHSHGSEPETVHDQIPFPAGHEYPTATSIHQFVTTNNILRGGKAISLSVEEVQTMLDILTWDDKLEQVNGGYRTVRGVKFKQPGEEDDVDDEMVRKRGNGLTEMPCGQCPVIDLCGTGGPISATNCVYFDRWLGSGITA